MGRIGGFLVAVQDEHGFVRPPWLLEDLTNWQLWRLLDNLVDELVRRDAWTGPRPIRAPAEEIITESELRLLDGNR